MQILPYIRHRPHYEARGHAWLSQPNAVAEDGQLQVATHPQSLRVLRRIHRHLKDFSGERHCKKEGRISVEVDKPAGHPRKKQKISKGTSKNFVPELLPAMAAPNAEVCQC
ncbi:hypothetical protein TNCV_234991 [Trichonephila clavipes]|uniref:Uncharacterized protein n=1 Tax=Trichonephila clavipes TaxID=2585209 RepID=A0A8X6VNX6_TRICX|nr:hypothetical protein TNCV_234991 [Trichonephila clavipes]